MNDSDHEAYGAMIHVGLVNQRCHAKKTLEGALDRLFECYDGGGCCDFDQLIENVREALERQRSI